MTSADQRKAQTQVERAVNALIKKGWRCAYFGTEKEGAGPFTVTLTLTIEDYDREPEKGVM